jgi:hypothetical protein
MTKTSTGSRDAKAGFILGRKGFAKISAVEGIRLSADMEKRFRDFDRQGLSAGDRRKTIARAFAKDR